MRLSVLPVARPLGALSGPRALAPVLKGRQQREGAPARGSSELLGLVCPVDVGAGGQCGTLLWALVQETLPSECASVCPAHSTNT